MFTAAEKRAVQATCRVNGAVGANAVVPRIIKQVAKKTDSILDFGCGYGQIHVKSLTESGFNVKGYDFSIPGSEMWLQSKFDIVYASNVLNVQTSEDMLKRTLGQIRKCTGRLAVMNYPASPRKIGLSTKNMKDFLAQYFSEVNKIACINIFICCL